MGVTPLQILGLDEDATVEEIRTAWKTFAWSNHPDRGGDAQEFTRVNRAYHAAMQRAHQPRRCPECNGSGHTIEMNGFDSIKLICQVCGGEGKVSA